ncbi:MAG: hypothetical protein A2051_03540 [Desulfovibrionales bacterium GWA2_65_9]|nr:MAG: hypothetical protein A2051_03540 [Desulfovibrionales bacterium GWA2_65_9]
MQSKVFCLCLVLLLGPLIVSSHAAEPDQGSLKSFPAPPAGPNALAQKLNPVAAVEAMNKSIRASEQQNQAAVAALAQAQAENKPAQSAPAAKAGGGKVIYGDIIIHK